MGRLNVLILSDGKPGHVNQSRGLAHFLDTTSVREVNVEFKSGRHEMFTRLALRRLLNKPPVQILKEISTEIGLTVFDIEGETPPDLIISTGNTTAAVAALLKKGFGCKAVHVMRPSLVPLEMFDAVVLHAHDVTKNKTLPLNVLTIGTAPNPLTPSTLDEIRPHAKKRLGDSLFITAIFGGNSRQRELTPDIAHRLLKALFKRAYAEKARLLITTSRRTPEEIDSFLIRELEGVPECRELVIANRDEVNPITEYLSLSHGCVMTEESVSMIGEVASTGFVPLAVALKPRGRRVTKLDRFLERAHADGLIRRQDQRPLGEFVVHEPFLPLRKDIDSPTQRCARRIVELLKLF